jgi:transcriptional regulator with XRE-family HTH domain
METLRFERFLKRISQEKLAKEAGLTQSTVSRIERGLRPVKPEEKKVIARALGLSVGDLFPSQEAQP